MCKSVYFFSEKKIGIGERIAPMHNNSDGWSEFKTRMEKVLERVRQSEEHFSDYPSRYYCHYLAATEKSANEWFKTIKISTWRNQHSPLVYYLYKVSLHHSIKWFDAKILLDFRFMNVNHYDDIAHRYWNSAHDESICGNEDEEGLTDAEITIIERKKMEINSEGNYHEVNEEYM